VVLVVSYHRGHPVGGGNPLSQRQAHVFLWSEGMIMRETTYPDLAEARTAAERLAQKRG